LSGVCAEFRVPASENGPDRWRYRLGVGRQILNRGVPPSFADFSGTYGSLRQAVFGRIWCHRGKIRVKNPSARTSPLKSGVLTSGASEFTLKRLGFIHQLQSVVLLLAGILSRAGRGGGAGQRAGRRVHNGAEQTGT